MNDYRPISTLNNNTRQLDYTDFIRVNNELIRKDLITHEVRNESK